MHAEMWRERGWKNKKILVFFPTKVVYSVCAYHVKRVRQKELCTERLVFTPCYCHQLLHLLLEVCHIFQRQVNFTPPAQYLGERVDGRRIAHTPDVLLASQGSGQSVATSGRIPLQPPTRSVGVSLRRSTPLPSSPPNGATIPRQCQPRMITSGAHARVQTVAAERVSSNPKTTSENDCFLSNNEVNCFMN